MTVISAAAHHTHAPADEDSAIQISGLVAAYNGRPVVHGVNLTIAQGEHVSLLGPSGCGKSTTLRCIAGLETPIAGRISIGSRVVFANDENINVTPDRRDLAMVFQSYAVWPHMSVFGNVAYGPRLRGIRGLELTDKVERTLSIVGLEDFSHSRATQLSGGQQQRVALARSFATDPKALLLDEPLSNLDAQLRIRMRRELRALQRSLGLTTLYVTHDQEEAIALSDRIVVMDQGRICQIGPPEQVYHRPASLSVARFLGVQNLLPGELRRVADDWQFTTNSGATINCAAPDRPLSQQSTAGWLAIRATQLRLSAAGMAEGGWPGVVDDSTWLGEHTEYTITSPAGTFAVRSSAATRYRPGDAIELSVPAADAVPILET